MRHSYEEFSTLLCQDDNGKLIDSFVSVELGRDVVATNWEAFLDQCEDEGTCNRPISELGTDFALSLLDEVDISAIDFAKLTGNPL